MALQLVQVVIVNKCVVLKTVLVRDEDKNPRSRQKLLQQKLILYFEMNILNKPQIKRT